MPTLRYVIVEVFTDRALAGNQLAVFTDGRSVDAETMLAVPEDPTTGSAAGPLACHVCHHGLVPWGTEIEISKGEDIGRPSTLYARADGSDAGIERVEVGGRAVVVAQGEFRLGSLVAG